MRLRVRTLAAEVPRIHRSACGRPVRPGRESTRRIGARSVAQTAGWSGTIAWISYALSGGDVDGLVADASGPARLVVNRHRDLVPGQSVLGQPWNVLMASEPGYATLHHTARVAIALAAQPAPAAVPGFGDL